MTTPGGTFWPLWVLIGLAVIVGIHALRVVLGVGVRGEMEERIDMLTTTRAGAVDAQAAELRRIERDLHDGAQARLVALAMDLGMARERLRDAPHEAQTLVAGAHEEANVDLDERLDPALEAAAYFAVAESLANAGKYSGARVIDVSVSVARPSDGGTTIEAVIPCGS